MSEKVGHLALLKHTNGQWIAVVEKGREATISSQALVSSDEGFPHDRVTKLIELGKRIVQVAFGQGTWFVLMQEEVNVPSGPMEQHVGFTKSFPEAEIQTAWKDGRRVVCLDYLDEQWVLVTEKSASSLSVGQSVVFSNEALPGTLLQDDLWNKEKRLICLSFHSSVGWVLLGEPRGSTGQSYAAGSDWPQEKVADRLSKGMTVAGISWNTTDEAWAIVFDNASKTQNVGTKIHFDKSFNEDLMRTLSLTRYGKRF
jgi:hypothetical protein